MKEKMTVGMAFELIAKETKSSKLTQNVLDSIAAPARFLKRKLGLNVMQCYILSVVLENSGENVSSEDLAEYADISHIRVMRLYPQIEKLVAGGFLDVVGENSLNAWNSCYSASLSLVNAVRFNGKLELPDYKKFTPDDMWQSAKSFLQKCDYNRISYTKMLTEIKSLLSGCAHIDFCRKITDLGLDDENMVLLMIICNCLVNKSEDYVSECDYNDVIPAVAQNRIVFQFKAGNNKLIAENLVEAKNSDCNEFRLTKNGITFLLGEEYIPKSYFTVEENKNNPSQNVVAKQMFYNANEAVQIQRLANLLDQENFAKIQARMRNMGMREGFCCIFHGAPGTGKTETVLQLARKTGREIIQVDLSAIKDKYVGESEKNIKMVFTDYKEKLQQSSTAPILLFNEADAVFGKRHTGINSEVEQMSNAMQNIILQAMEDFDGILIATTNLTDNIDSAFDRRFLYKVEFKKPSCSVRKKIWLSMIPELSEEDASMIAARYEFSGGQIENVARRMMVDTILYDRELTCAEVISVCDEEKLSNGKKFGINKISA